MAFRAIHTEKLYSKLEDFFRTGRHTDVTIECGDKNFECHRLVLAGACEYFDAMFGGQFCERTAESISLRELPIAGLNAQIFEQVLQFIYTGDTQIDSGNVFPLLQASEFFKLSGIEGLCVQFIKVGLNGITVQNILNIFMFACSTKKESLVGLLSVHIAKQFKIFSRTNAFLDTPFDDLGKILICFNSLSMRNEDALLNAITQWIHHDREERLQYFNEFVKMIRFENISSTYVQFMFTKFFLDTHNSTSVHQTLKPIGYSEDTILQETAAPLYVFVKHQTEKFLTVYSINDGQIASVSDWVPPTISPVPLTTNPVHWTRSVILDNFYLYNLNYSINIPRPQDSSYEQTFCAYTLVNASSELKLKSPPMNFHGRDTSLCAIKNNIYAYYPFSTNVVSQNTSNLRKFNNEEIKRGICVYNCEVDDWFSVPAMKSKVIHACMTVHNDILYLIGGVRLDNIEIPRYVQMYDCRIGKWQELPKTFYTFFDASCCSLNKYVYVCGEEDETQVERYDTVAGKWNRLSFHIPLQRKKIFNRQLVPYNNKLCWMGGFSLKADNDGYVVPTNNLLIDVFNTLICRWGAPCSVLRDASTSRSGTIIDAVLKPE